MKKNISVVMPAYNASSWLDKSIPRVDKALTNANVTKAEFIVVDDGSTDNTAQAARGLKTHFPITVVSQRNSGRFLARKLGAQKAKYDFILFIDTRIYIELGALKFVIGEMAKNPERKVWASHVYLDKEANIYARFWDALASLAWRKYFSNPRDYSYGIKEFDYFPKGTGCFFVPKKIIQEANNWFVKNTKDLKNSNDDTLLIRHIAEKNNINLNPKYSSIYHARSSLGKYAKHVFFRGKFFVDGFLRRDGNRFFWPLVLFLVLSVVIPIVLAFNLSMIIPAFVACILLLLLGFLVSIVLGIPLADAWALFILSPIFVIAYGAGIWSAFYKLCIASLFGR